MWITVTVKMDGIHPKFVLSKRFPVHAAIEQLNLHALKVCDWEYLWLILTLLCHQDLLTPISDARFHFGRKLTNTDISVLHQACANRPHGHQAVVDIVKLCTAMGAPVNDVDCIGQHPLFYAVRYRYRIQREIISTNKFSATARPSSWSRSYLNQVKTFQRFTTNFQHQFTAQFIAESSLQKGTL